MFISVVVIVVGLIGLFLFGMPVGIIGMNMGNATGLVISVGLVVYGFFRKPVNRLIGRMAKHIAGKLLLGFSGVVVLVILVLVIIESCLMVGAALDTPDNTDVTVVVLGCKVNGTSPSLTLKMRLDAAHKYMEENPTVKCVVSGGQGPDEGISEAQCMYNYLVAKGISPERVYKEDKSTSTRENFQFSAELINHEGLSRDIVIVTNEFHMYRAGKVADELGLKHKSVPAETVWYLFPTYYVRELWGILYQWVF